MADLFDAWAPGHALHVIQRGFAGRDCFRSDRDRLAYLHWLGRFGAQAGCALHAYVLMKNHVHVLLTPSRANGVSRLMHALAEKHGALVEPAGGPVWDPRHEVWPVHPRRYLLACMRYIELNPVRAELVVQPSDYPWSSHRANALGREDGLVSPHAHYYALGRTATARRTAYRAMFRADVARSPRAEYRVTRRGGAVQHYAHGLSA
jgi:putative transposase